MNRRTSSGPSGTQRYFHISLPLARLSIDGKLAQWAIAAGVSKKITFHSARHTHATLLLSHGVDIYTVSKLLGHKHIVSTERYAHITDNLKIETINKSAI